MILFYASNYRSYLPCEHMIDCVEDCAHMVKSVCQVKALGIDLFLVRNKAIDNAMSSADAHVYGASFLYQSLRSSKTIISCPSFK